MRWRAKDFGYLLPFGLTAVLFVLTNMGGVFRGAGMLVAFAIVPVLDKLIGLDTENVPAEEEPAREASWYFRSLLLLWVPVQLGIMTYAMWRIDREAAPLWFAALLGVPLGLMNGGVGINVAHELGHRNTWPEKWGARLLLCSVSYGHFTVEHNLGHHIRVATPVDPATARLGEGFWRFLFRTIPGQFVHAWRIENARVRRARGRALSLHNRMIWLVAAPFAIMAVLFAYGGASGGPRLLVYFLSQSLFAILLLEAVNYVEHYGLLRAETAPGVYEKVQPRHSWNASFMVTNWILFGLQRHSDHHAYAGRRYQILRHTDGAPQLPAGYPVMIMLALVPPLWRRTMDWRVLNARKITGNPFADDPMTEAR